MGQSPSRSAWDDYGTMQPEGTGDLAPIGTHIRHGLEVIGALAVLSLVLCASLFLFITYRLIDGRLRDRRLTRLPAASRQAAPSDNDPLVDVKARPSMTMPTPASPGLSLFPEGLRPMNKAAEDAPAPHAPHAPPHAPSLLPTTTTTTADHDHDHHHDEEQQQGGGDGRRVRAGTGTAVPNIRKRYTGYHPLLVLIYCLLMADIIQSASFIPNLVWARQDAIRVRTGTCWAQGWLRSQGDMASSLFAAAVSINTYLMVVRRYTIPSRALWAIVGTIWSFSFLIVAAGVWAAQNGRGHGGYFVRVDTWCWISSEYATTRLWTHFGWVLSCFAIILVSYVATTIIVYRRPATTKSRGFRSIGFKWRNLSASGHHPAFLIYPLVYFFCCIPMALGPMILMAGASVNGDYFLWAGAMIASNGWLDVILWSCTMIFLTPKDIQNAGLQDFRFLRTSSVKYGNIVYVEGGLQGGGAETGEDRSSRRPAWGRYFVRSKYPEMRMMKDRNNNSRPRAGSGGWGFEMVPTGSRDPGSAIQIERSTTVVVEDCEVDTKYNSIGNAARRMSDIVSVPKRVAHLF